MTKKKYPETVYALWHYIPHMKHWHLSNVHDERDILDEAVKDGDLVGDLYRVTEHKIMPPDQPKKSELVQEAE